MNKLILFILIFAAFDLSGEGSVKQQHDSLLNLLSVSKEDTNKVIVLYNIAYLFQDNDKEVGFQNNPDTGISYALRCLDLAERLNFEKGKFYSKLYLGRIYWRKGLFSKAIMYHLEALKYAEEKRDTGYVGFVCTYIGQDYADDGKYQEAIKYFEKAKKAYEEIKDVDGVANLYLLLSWVSASSGNLPQSTNYDLEALRIYESINYEYGIAIASSNLAQDYYKLDKYDEAIHYLNSALVKYVKVNDNVNRSGNYITLSSIYISLRNFNEAMLNARKALEIGFAMGDPISKGAAYDKISEIYFLQSKHDSSARYQELAILELSTVNSNQLLAIGYGKLALSYLRLNQKVKAKQALDSAEYFTKKNDALPALETFYNGRSLYDSISGDWKNAYFNFYKYISIRDTINNTANDKKMLQNKLKYDYEKKEATTKTLQEKKDIRQRTIRNSVIAALVGTLIFLVVVYRQRNKISKARKRSDELLLNILPEEVAEELKSKGNADAKQFDIVTVMFTDFKDFTKISEHLSPSDLVAELDTCFKAFDEIIHGRKIEKIKTIGDAYMCAGGLPVVNVTHAADVVSAAIEIRDFMTQYSADMKQRLGESFEIRIGIHSGSVVAGIVGMKKFAYDIWGDTVNIAARMESSGEVGRVNISSATFDLVKDKFNCTQRGKIQAKNKGDIDMYFVEAV